MSARDFMGSGSLAGSSYADVEDADPRVGLVNLADVMLVFACGLMLALVTYWNLDISNMTEVIQADEVTEVSGIEDMADQMLGGGSSFTELGMVYEDPMTGKMYMLKEDVGARETGEAAAEGSSASTGAGTASASAQESQGGAEQGETAAQG